MRRIARTAALPVLVLALAAPALADVTYSTGDYKGTTSQKNGHHKFRKITFHADSVAGEITKMKFVESGTCSDGGTSSGSQKNLHTTVDANGKFVIDAVSKSGATKLHLTGAISATRPTVSSGSSQASTATPTTPTRTAPFKSRPGQA